MMPASSARPPRPVDAVTLRSRAERAAIGIGWLPALVLSAAVGVLLCAVTDALSRQTLAPSPLLYWLGILVLAVPIFYRLTSREASARERLALVCVLGLSLYLVKVMRDAPIFTFSDELVHAFNVHQIAVHGHLFHPNPILEVTRYYPGLEGAVSSLVSLTGLSAFPCGVVLIGVARLVLIASLFLLFQRVGGSARLAGLGVAIYAGNYNFLFWGAQFSYESLALPLLVMVLMALAEREAAPRAALRAWSVPVLLGMMAIVITHHLTSYALVVVLVALALAGRWVRATWRPPNPWRLAVIGALLALAWLLVVASATVGYLSPVLTNAIKAIAHTIAGEEPPRSLFHGSGTIEAATPLAGRGIALLAVVLLAVGLPFGLREIRRRYMARPFALLFALAAVGFFGTLALRLTPPAWETGNRLSEFLFIGLAFLLACAAVAAGRRWPRSALRRPLLTAGLALILVGGALAGWPWDSQLAQPLRATAEGRTIVSPPMGLAEWARDSAPPSRFAASVADAGLLLTPGERFAFAGSSPDVEDLLEEEHLNGWELPLLARNHMRYVVVDRRPSSGDSLRGYYFADRGTRLAELGARNKVTKFNRIPGVARVYTNGTITVFDLGPGR